METTIKQREFEQMHNQPLNSLPV
ncbi:MAG: hypothetical protein JWQ25_1326, partial [Daejeonella sp.]|nr:hypothetical protein [Daejeonella sp.]